ncbi:MULTISPECIES: DUF262 domain-containing protein [unclassified Arthrobacter]|uniref:DUF262 domain-containing protein n=1 Tax=unclassified Arthrobacter TaxID=235627 RepID=UPI001E3BC0CA|nr:MULTISPECIES: DUF262 domain-containing protein [unclassified Arthrobacter]MCC9146353.1 DUF262 domain-containing protein [Arthrobacter sp. zg-Y919]MDK1277583.1 DUF262 domain-containing protein [Arthrobacter sp. zg.Y919]WIB02455.1 DUF262 domain-containing protein [Arthrobacter sp. zg-Y919]
MSSPGSLATDPAVTANQLTAAVRSVEDIFGKMTLHIPSYQRPYSWTVKNVDQLLNDIVRFRRAGHYRIGTFILNPSADEASKVDSARILDIVDGQQRYLSFALIIHALAASADKIDPPLREQLRNIQRTRIPVRNDGRSEKNLRQNYSHLKQVISRWGAQEVEQFTEFFLKECSVVVLEVRDLDSAFQMFDSQNTRGRALFPTDLLKAYHLREFSRTAPSPETMLAVVRGWESIPPEEINHLIGGVLFPIKQWSANRPVPRKGFSAAHVDLFKGIRGGAFGNSRFRWAQPTLLATAMTDRFAQDNSTLLRHGVLEHLEFPFQLTQPIIDGEMFFRMVHHYVREARRAGIQKAYEPPPESGKLRDPQLAGIMRILDTQPTGTGNRYLRELFDCFLMAYLDRFGWHQVDAAALVLARHVYLLRVYLQRVLSRSVDKHARLIHDLVQREDENLFAEIALARSPDVVLSRVAFQIAEDHRIPPSLEALFKPSFEQAEPKEQDS